MLAAVIGIRDPLWPGGDPSLPELIHGSAFERVTAFQTGFDDGISSCVQITPEEVTTRRGSLPQEFIEKGQTGEFAINADSVKTALDSLKKLFPLDNPPALSFGGPSCPDGPSGPVASYCPSSNTIAVDLPRLILTGTSLSRGSPFDLMPNSLFGDYTAYSVLVSRYMLAVQNEHGGLAVDDVDAALRTACLTGVATAKLAKGVTSAAAVGIRTHRCVPQRSPRQPRRLFRRLAVKRHVAAGSKDQRPDDLCHYCSHRASDEIDR